MVKRLAVVLTLSLVSCNQLDANVIYPCEVGDACPSGLSCWSDGFCRRGDESKADAGLDAGETVDAGLPDAGSDGGVDAGPTCECPSAQTCGHFDAGLGCPALFCGTCRNGLECGVSSANVCGVPRLCRPDGWCFENPLPQGSTINALWSPDGERVFLAGNDATLLEWNGERHRFLDVGGLDVAGIDFRDVNGRSADDFFVVGTRGTVLHFVDGGWVKESLDSFQEARLDVVLGGTPARALGEFASVYVRDAQTGQWRAGNLMGFGGGRFNDALQRASGAQFALGTSAVGSNAELSSPVPDGGRNWTLLGSNLELRRGLSLTEFSGELLLAGESFDGGGALVRWSADAGARAVLVSDSVFSSVTMHRGEVMVVYGTSVLRVSSALARAPQPLMWTGLELTGLDGGLFLDDGGALPPPPTEFPGDTRWNGLVSTRWGVLAEGQGGGAAFLADDAGLTALSGGARGPRVEAVCEDVDGGLYGPAASCSQSLCTPRFYEVVADQWRLTESQARDAGALGNALWCQTIASRALATDTSRVVTEFNRWVPDRNMTLPRPVDFWMSSFSRGWFVSDSQSLVRTDGVVGLTSTPVTYDGGGDDLLAVGGVFGNGEAWAVGESGLVVFLPSDAGMVEQPRLGMRALRAVRGTALDDGGSLVFVVGNDGAQYALDAPDAGFVAVPFGFQSNLQKVVLSSHGDRLMSGRPLDGGVAHQLFFAAPGAAAAPVPFQGSTRPALLLRRTDAGVEAVAGGDNGSVLRRRLP